VDDLVGLDNKNKVHTMFNELIEPPPRLKLTMCLMGPTNLLEVLVLTQQFDCASIIPTGLSGLE
jgi:hypothetical protein